MKIQAEISLYPLCENEYSRPIKQFIRFLDNNNLNIKTGPMSTLVAGDSQVLFEKLQQAFEQIADEYKVVMTSKISNVCPKVNQDK